MPHSFIGDVFASKVNSGDKTIEQVAPGDKTIEQVAPGDKTIDQSVKYTEGSSEAEIIYSPEIPIAENAQVNGTPSTESSRGRAFGPIPNY